jgi:hypothetical protein
MIHLDLAGRKIRFQSKVKGQRWGGNFVFHPGLRYASYLVLLTQGFYMSRLQRFFSSRLSLAQVSGLVP